MVAGHWKGVGMNNDGRERLENTLDVAEIHKKRSELVGNG
jgi:hypothetical protein